MPSWRLFGRHRNIGLRSVPPRQLLYCRRRHRFHDLPLVRGQHLFNRNGRCHLRRLRGGDLSGIGKNMQTYY